MSVESIQDMEQTYRNTEFITDRQIYEKVICGVIPEAKRFLWIGTSDIKDLHVKKGRNMVPFLEILSDLVRQGVAVRLIHAKEPGPAFRRDFDRYPDLISGLERMLCPRVHFKTVVVDGESAYSGSANLTGAGMGAKSPRKRNFEGGFLSRDPLLVESIMKQFDKLWIGEHCPECLRKEYCNEYEDLLE
jgi:phosphatidylserine/phosphatidylglycerophosphate/cardiolipin synthase-like enzyme